MSENTIGCVVSHSNSYKYGDKKRIERQHSEKTATHLMMLEQLQMACIYAQKILSLSLIFFNFLCASLFYTNGDAILFFLIVCFCSRFSTLNKTLHCDFFFIFFPITCLTSMLCNKSDYNVL